MKIFNKNYSLTTKIFVATIFVMTLSCLTNTLTSLFDGFVVSKYIGDDGTAVRSLCNAIDKLIIGLAQLIGLGTQVVVTKYLSKGNREKANKVFNMMFFICIVIGLIFTIIGLAIPKYVVIALSSGQKISDKLLTQSTYYLFGYFIGVPFCFLTQLLSPLVILDGNKRLAKISIYVVIVVNCLCSFLFAKFMNSNMFGIGLASSISAIVCFIILISHFFRKKSSLTFKFCKPNSDDVKDVLVNGSPMGLKYICVTVKLFLFNLIILSVGEKYMPGSSQVILTARGAQETISVLFETTCGGILLTTIMMGSVFYNEENKFELSKLFKNVFKFAIIVNFTVAIAYFFSARAIATAYLPKDSPSLELCIFGMRCGAITIFFLPFNSLFLGFLQSTRRIKYAYLTTFLQSFALPVGCMAAFGYSIGAYGLFVGYMVSTMLYLPIHLLVSTIRNRHFPRNLNELFYLDKSFGYYDKCEIHENIYNKDDLALLQSKINNFSKENNIKTDALSKYVTNITNIVFDNTFNKNNKSNHCLTIDVISKNGAITIRTRDNSYKYNFLEDNNIKNNELNELISSIKKDKSINIKYSYVLKTNNYTITL